MKPFVLVVLLAFVFLVVSATACARPAPQATPPTASAAFTPLPIPSPLPVSPGAARTPQPKQADGPGAIVARFDEAWAHGTSEDVVALFADKIEYQMGPNYVTDRGALWRFTEYWKVIGSKLWVTRCDPEVGNTIRCDLEYTSNCSPYLKLSPIHFDTTFTVRKGKIETLIATMPPEELQELTKILQGMFAWTSANMPTEWAEAKKDMNPRRSALIELKGCIEYAKSVMVTPTATP